MGQTKELTNEMPNQPLDKGVSDKREVVEIGSENYELPFKELIGDMIILKTEFETPITEIMNKKLDRMIVGRFYVAMTPNKEYPFKVGDLIDIANFGVLTHIPLLNNYNSMLNIKDVIRKKDNLLAMTYSQTKVNATSSQHARTLIDAQGKEIKIEPKAKDIKLAGVELVRIIDYYYTPVHNVIAIFDTDKLK